MFHKLVFSLILSLSTQTKTPPKPATPPAAAQPKPAAKPTPSALTSQEIAKVVESFEDAAKLWEAVQAAEGKHTTAKSDENKQALAKAHFDFAENVMLHVNIPGLGTPMPESKRYLIAYQSYKRILEVDAKPSPQVVVAGVQTTADAASKGRIQTIQNIYISWGKSLP